MTDVTGLGHLKVNVLLLVVSFVVDRVNFDFHSTHRRGEDATVVAPPFGFHLPSRRILGRNGFSTRAGREKVFIRGVGRG